MSFIPALEKLRSLMETDASLVSYCTTTLGKVITGHRRFKLRTEVGMDELPVALITKPSSDKTSDSCIAGTSIDLVRMYIGFFCDDLDQAQDILVMLEQLIDSAIMMDPTLTGLVEYTYPGSSANDEGMFHPVYFMVKEFHIHREVIWSDKT